jgi:small subunit ribosomal protein S3
MEERKFIKLKKEEFGIKEAIRRNLGMGKISKLDIEYTPVGEKIIISTSKPGLVIGRRGEKIEELTRLLKKRFKLENPHIEINEIENPLFDAQVVADEIAMALERMGNLKFKVIAYRKLQEIVSAGALGCELRITGKLPSERARSWRFAQGYLKKAGESRKEIDRAEATALTKTGIIGIKVAIMSPDARVYDRIDIDDKMKAMIKGELKEGEEKDETSSKKEKKKTSETVKKILKSNEKSKKEISENKSPKSSKIDKIGEIKVIDESDNLKLKPEEEGTAMIVAEELEEGVPGDQIDKDVKKSIKKEKVNKAKKPKGDKN